MSQSAEDIFLGSVAEVARERFTQFLPQQTAFGPTPINPGGIAREIVRARSTCLGKFATKAFNQLLPDHVLTAAKTAIEIEAFRPFCELIVEARIEPATAQRLQRAYVQLTVAGIKEDMRPEFEELMNGIAKEHTSTCALSPQPRSVERHF